jgi:hypothetical protein
MRKNYKAGFPFLFFILLLNSSSSSAMKNIPADDSNIQYYGRWDFSDPKAPTHSWGGVYILARFEGTSIGITVNDNASYFNVFIDDSLISVFHGDKDTVASYTLATGLTDENHKILLTKRYETPNDKHSFNGFILGDRKNLLPPPPKPKRKIEFIGDSYTSAEGNEWTEQRKISDDSYSNMYKGFGAIIARHYSAQYHMTSRSGFGLLLDWQGDYKNNLPDYFDRTLFCYSDPTWDFSKWIPDLVVICLGLNDYNGLGGYTGPVDSLSTELFKSRYHEFIGTILRFYPGVKILLVAPNDLDWIKEQASTVVADENSRGHKNIYYTYFPLYDDHFVNDGHPDVVADQMIAERLIEKIDTMNVWEK